MLLKLNFETTDKRGDAMIIYICVKLKKKKKMKLEGELKTDVSLSLVHWNYQTKLLVSKWLGNDDSWLIQGGHQHHLLKADNFSSITACFPELNKNNRNVRLYNFKSNIIKKKMRATFLRNTKAMSSLLFLIKPSIIPSTSPHFSVKSPVFSLLSFSFFYTPPTWSVSLYLLIFEELLIELLLNLPDCSLVISLGFKKLEL